MKSLPEIIDDLSVRSALLTEQALAITSLLAEQADELREVAAFFGGVPRPAVRLPEVRLPEARPIVRRGRPPGVKDSAPRKAPNWPMTLDVQPVIAAPTPVPVVTLSPTPAPAPAPPLDPPPQRYASDGRKIHESGRRDLSPEEKIAIVRDYNSFPPHLQTRENRAALACKYRCAPMQIYALSRDDGHLERNRQIIKERRLLTQPPPSPVSRAV